jgi:V8-like Glu-specific endopeptidase
VPYGPKNLGTTLALGNLERNSNQGLVKFMTNLIDWNNFNSSLLIEVTRPSGVFTCSGVAINENTILTAAHCLEGEILKVRVSTEASYNKEGSFLEIESFNLHPDYDSKKSNYRSDLAKIKMKDLLPTGTKFFPIIKQDSSLNGKLMRLGFGSRGQNNVRTLVNPEFKMIRNQEKVLELNDMYSYSGDSGGPIFLQNKGQMYLVAIHSTLSFGPEGKHSFNPLLSTHREWIAS